MNIGFKPIFSITNQINNALVNIERVRGFLDAAILSADWIQDMQNRALVLEAHHTTHIEGTELTLAQAEKILAGNEVKNINLDDQKELINYSEAFEFVSQYLDEHKPITEGLIREIHKYLVRGVRGNSAAPGEYRKIQNYVANAQSNEKVVKVEYPKKHGLDKIYKKLRWSNRNSLGKWLKEGYEIVIGKDEKTGSYYKLQLKDGDVLVGKK